MFEILLGLLLFSFDQCCQMWRLLSKTAVAPKVAIFGNFGGDLDKKSSNTDQIKTITVSAKFQKSAVPLELLSEYTFSNQLMLPKKDAITLTHLFSVTSDRMTRE